MTRDDIIRMAREGGWDVEWGGTTIENVSTFAALVAAAEREACIAACEAVAEEHSQVWGLDGAAAAHECAARIRDRSRAEEPSP